MKIDFPFLSFPPPLLQVPEASEKGSPKKLKAVETKENEKVKTEEDSKKTDEDLAAEKQTHAANSKPPEPPKDYIHVRARRGQATDSHSLAERVSQFHLLIS